jgi:hypothetical protein
MDHLFATEEKSVLAWEMTTAMYLVSVVWTLTECLSVVLSLSWYAVAIAMKGQWILKMGNEGMCLYDGLYKGLLKTLLHLNHWIECWKSCKRIVGQKD